MTARPETPDTPNGVELSAGGNPLAPGALVGVSGNDRRVYDALCRAADNNRACPSNPELCGILDAQSVSAGANVIARLEKRGLILVLRYQSAREITIVASGKSTYVHPSQRKPHWRDRPAGRTTPRPRTAKRKGLTRYVMSERIDDADLPPATFRDPCPRCGVRADIGCQHSGAPVSMGAFA